MMQELNLEANNKTPQVLLQDGLIRIEGRSIVEDPKVFYKKVENWVKKYLEDPKPITEVHLEMEYCDTASTKCIYDVLKILAIYNNGDTTNKIIFNWHYEHGDGEMLELGEFLESKLKVEFNFIEE